MMPQLDTASMRHMTHEKMKSHIVQGKAEMKSPFQQKKPSSRETEFPCWSQRDSVNSCICSVLFTLVFVVLSWLPEMPPS